MVREWLPPTAAEAARDGQLAGEGIGGAKNWKKQWRWVCAVAFAGCIMMLVCFEIGGFRRRLVFQS